MKNLNTKLFSFENFIRKNNATLSRDNEIYNLEDIYIYYDKENPIFKIDAVSPKTSLTY